jgi:hypothetical protein
MTTFSIKESLKTGWGLFKTNWKFIIPLGAVTILAKLFVSGMMQLSSRHSIILGLALWIISALVSIIIALGWSQIFLNLIRHGHADWNTFKTEPKLWLHLIKTEVWYIFKVLLYLVYTALPFAVIAVVAYKLNVGWLQTAAAIAAGAAVVIVGIYLQLRYQFLSFAVLDYSEFRSKIVLKKAGDVTKNVIPKLFLFNIVCGLIALLGLICILFGLVIAIPVIKLAQAKVYDELLKSKTHS